MALPVKPMPKRFVIPMGEFHNRIALLILLKARVSLMVNDKPSAWSEPGMLGDFVGVDIEESLMVELSPEATDVYINHLANDRVNIDFEISELESRKAKIKLQLDQIGSQIFDESGSKKIAPGLLLKEETDIVFDDETALKWALELPAARASVLGVGKTHEANVFSALISARPDLIPCLIVNTTAYKKAAREGQLPGIPGTKSVTRSVSVTVADVAPLLSVTNIEKPATMEDVPF